MDCVDGVVEHLCQVNQCRINLRTLTPILVPVLFTKIMIYKRKKMDKSKPTKVLLELVLLFSFSIAYLLPDY